MIPTTTKHSKLWNLELYKPYHIKDRRFRWGGRTVYIGETSAKYPNSLPSFVHGYIHVYDYDTLEYLGFCGATYFREKLLKLPRDEYYD